MSDIAIRVENLSKAYRIGLKEQKHETLMGAMSAAVLSPFKNFRDLRNLSRFDNAGTADKPQPSAFTPHPPPVNPQLSGFIPQPSPTPSDVFWALRDVSFEVKHGEVLGIIGRNGAGKSTLLKILARITEPTTGRAEVYGRVASLLEVGTGFHPDLTGRENVYLNGTILGMSKNDVDRKFEEIVAFSEVEKFIDTPVKRYSSGMRMRLAFSVAAHLDSEILIIDEVLAVGDMRFQRKCLGSMEEIALRGRTLLFVSHNLGAIKDLCSKALVLQGGQTAYLGDTLHGLNYYTSPTTESSNEALNRAQPIGWSLVQVCADDTAENGKLLNNTAVRLTARLDLPEPVERARLYCIIDGPDGEALVHTFENSEMLGQESRLHRSFRIELKLPPLWLIPDAYTLHLKLFAQGRGGRQVSLASERVLLDMKDGTGQMDGKVRARLIPSGCWQVSCI